MDIFLYVCSHYMTYPRSYINVSFVDLLPNTKISVGFTGTPVIYLPKYVINGQLEESHQIAPDQEESKLMIQGLNNVLTIT